MGEDLDDMLERKVDELAQRLRQERDELKLKVHLAKMEAKDEWADSEAKWESFENKLQVKTSKTKETAEDIHEVLRDLGEDLSSAYRRIRDLL